MLILLFVLCFGAAAAATAVKDTVFYDLIGVRPTASQFVLNAFLEDQQHLYNPSNYGHVLSTEVQRLGQIIQHVGEILLDPSKRQLYDQEGPPFPVALFEFSSIFIDDVIIRTLQRDFTSNEFHDQTSSDAITSTLKVLYYSHIKGHIGLFLDALRQLQQSPFASLLCNNLSNHDITAVYGPCEIDEFLAALS